MLRRAGIFAVLAWSIASAASAQVAMLTQVSGDVSVSGSSGARPAVAFLKVNDGDTLTLAADAKVQMVYLTGGRQEIWTGAGPVQVGARQGASGTLTPQASQVPALVLRQLEKTPAVGQHGKTGMVTLRNTDVLEALDTLEKDYSDYRAKAAADDVTPEVFYLTGLIDLQDYGRAAKVIQDLEAKSRTQPAYAPVVEHFGRLLGEARASAPKRE
jgi:hypothetical protein